MNPLQIHARGATALSCCVLQWFLHVRFVALQWNGSHICSANIWFETILAEVEYDEDVWRDDASLTVGDADGELTYAMARDLCEKLLRRDPRKRITARQALKPPFLRRQREKV